MKKIQYILWILTLLITGAQAPVQAQQGRSCENPFTLTQDFSQTIMEASSFWYIANTFDLPMAITFRPYGNPTEAPYIELDFKCPSQEFYEDPALCDLFCKSKPSHTAMPYGMKAPKEYDNNGNPYYNVEFGEFYRDLLLKVGISYNVPVYIHVTFPCGGLLEMQPDAFSNCMDGSKFMHLGDTVHVAARDKERHVIVPYIQWQYDSIRYVWDGAEPCYFAVGRECGFDPMNDEGDARIIDGGPSSPNNPIQPGGQFKVSSELLMQYVDPRYYSTEAGMYFAKFYSDAPGIMTIERIPAPAPSCAATLMRLGESTALERNDTDAVFAMPSSWIKPMQFTSPTSHILKMYVGKNCDFTLGEAIAVYQFDRIENGHQLDLLEKDLKKLWQQKSDDENYLYVRFECSDKTTVRPALWSPSDCELKERLLRDKKVGIDAKSTVVYSLYYPDWKGGNLSFEWTNNQSACRFYIADTCKVTNSTEAPVFYSESIPSKSTFTVPQETVDSWESKVDPDGYLYILFYSRGRGDITASTSAKPEEDNPCLTYDSISDIVAFDSLMWHGQMYYASGRYTAYGTLDPETSCYDSIFTLNLNIRNTIHETVTETVCDSFVYSTKIYRESGSYCDTALVTGGHRKITTLELTIKQSTEASQTVMQYEPFTTASGKVLTESGIYLDTIGNAAGCDSIITYDLTIYNTGDVVIEKRGCDSIDIEGVSYYETGEYVDTLDIPGGDRVIRTLRLTIGHTSYAEETAKACGSYTSPRGNVYTESGDYIETLTNASGCDSIISLHVTIGQTTYGEDTRTSCVQYIAPWGEIYTESGEYTGMLKNVSGCDSIVTLQLTIISDCSSRETVYFCRGFNSEHEELKADGTILSYLPYTFESPAEWNYMDGVILEGEHDRTRLDLKRAEENLREHYKGGLTPISTIRWSVMYDGKGKYEPLTVTDEPQWIATGYIAVQVCFLCGEMYNTEFPTDIDQLSIGTESIKRMENGRVVIIRGGVKYDMFGTKIQ